MPVLRKARNGRWELVEAPGVFLDRERTHVARALAVGETVYVADWDDKESWACRVALRADRTPFLIGPGGAVIGISRIGHRLDELPRGWDVTGVSIFNHRKVGA